MTYTPKHTETEFDALIGRALAASRAEAAFDGRAANRVMARLADPLPRQAVVRHRLPALLLDWQFAPAWPRMTAFAACAVVGFLVGLAGLDRTLGLFDAQPTQVALYDFDSQSGIDP